MAAPALLMPFLIPASSTPKGPIPPQSHPPKIVRRRPDMEQGRALEVLGHAIEYLVDSHIFSVNNTRSNGDLDAIQILSGCSREVFATCAEIVPVHQRFKQWASEHLRTGSLHSRTRRV